MALTFGFYDSLNHDRLYNAQQMSAIFDGIINDGVFASVGSHFSVVPGTGMHVLVKSGRAWFNSTWTLNDSDIDLTIDAADTLLGRIDTVVLEVNSEQATRANSIKVVKGTAASSPVKPTLTNTATVHQHPLAHVTVAKNTTAITASMIEIVVGKTDCPFVTAILQTTDITNLFAKWENDFQTWFSTVRSTLDGDVALNLQNQIYNCVQKSDKATDSDLENGTADKWVDSSLLSKGAISVGMLLTDIADALADNELYELISDRQVSLKATEYSKLFSLLQYKYGYYVNEETILTHALDTSNISTAATYHDCVIFRAFKYNDHVYTFTRLATSNSDLSGSFVDVIMKDDNIVDVKYRLTSSTYYYSTNVIVMGNCFYKITAYVNGSNRQLYYDRWDASTESWHDRVTASGTFNDDSFSLGAGHLFDTRYEHNTGVVYKGGNLYIHMVNRVYSDAWYQTLVIINTSAQTMTYTKVATNNLDSILYDNGTLYGLSKDKTTFYIIDYTTGATNNSDNVPDHVKDILLSIDKYNLTYTNLSGTEYIVSIHPGSNGYSQYILAVPLIYVKYEDNVPIVRKTMWSSIVPDTVTNSITTMIQVHVSKDIYITCTLSGRRFYNLDGDELWMSASIFDTYKDYLLRTFTCSDKLDFSDAFYCPKRVSTVSDSPNGSFYIYKEQPEFFNADPVYSVAHSYLRVQ